MHYPASIIASSPKVARLTPSRWSAARIAPPWRFAVGLRSVSDEMAARTTTASKKTDLTPFLSAAQNLALKDQPADAGGADKAIACDRDWSNLTEGNQRACPVNTAH